MVIFCNGDQVPFWCSVFVQTTCSCTLHMFLRILSCFPSYRSAGGTPGVGGAAPNFRRNDSYVSSVGSMTSSEALTNEHIRLKVRSIAFCCRLMWCGVVQYVPFVFCYLVDRPYLCSFHVYRCLPSLAMSVSHGGPVVTASFEIGYISWQTLSVFGHDIQKI